MSIMKDTTSESHTSTGILLRVIPSHRIEKVVAIRLIAVAVEPTLVSRILSIQ